VTAAPRYCDCGCGTQLHGRADQRFIDDTCRKRFSRSQPTGLARELGRLIFTLSVGPETLDVASHSLALRESGVYQRWAKASGKPAIMGQVALLKRRFGDTERLIPGRSGNGRGAA
jgi:hypothetical protein